MTDARRLSARLREDEARLRELNFICSGKGGECRCEGCLHRQRRADNLSDAARLAELVENYAAARSHGTTYHLLGDGRLAVEYKNPDVHPAESALLTCDLIGREGVDG